MARISRYDAESKPAPPREILYSTAVYVRLSVENRHKEDRDSIENQKAMLLRYVERAPGLQLYSVYEDYGETGVNFERPGFERMLEDVRNGRVNCIAVKDLSRFGRSYLEVGEYIEKIFPFLGVRFIALVDGYDSNDPDSLDVMALHLKNLANDLYARDISQKIGSVFKEKQKRGEFIGSWAAYGYLKSETDKSRLVVDEDTAPVVRDIFRRRCEGWAYQVIARRLNEAGIPSPSRYRYNKGIVKNERFKDTLWNVQNIKRMTENEVYLGHMTQGRKKESLFEGKKQEMLPKSQWSIVKNTHEPIIDGEVFEAVRRIDEQARNRYFSNLGKHGSLKTSENILKGRVVCGCCGTNLVRYKNVIQGKRLRYSYICPIHSSDPGRCGFISIMEDELHTLIFQIAKKQIEYSADVWKICEKLSKEQHNRNRPQALTAKITETQKKLARTQMLRGSLYDNYAEGIMNEGDYLFAQSKYKKDEETLRLRLDQLFSEAEGCEKIQEAENSWSGIFDRLCNEKKLTKAMVDELISRIIVNEDKSITVLFGFEEEYLRLGDGVAGWDEGISE